MRCNWRNWIPISSKKMDDSWSWSQPLGCTVWGSVLDQGRHWTHQPLWDDRTSIKKVEKRTQAMQYMGNPYHKEGRDLLSLDAKDIVHQTAAVLIGTHLVNGKIHFQKFMKGLEVYENPPSMNQLKRTGLAFSNRYQHLLTLQNKKCWRQTVNCSPSCSYHTRVEWDLKEFFRHENQWHHVALNQSEIPPPYHSWEPN